MARLVKKDIALVAVRCIRDDFGELLELADHDGEHPLASLADLLESALDEPLVARLGRDHPDEASAVTVYSGRMPPDSDLAKRVTEPINAGQRSESVVDGGRQGPYGNLHELVDAERNILGERPVRSRDVRPAQRFGDPRGGCGRPHRRERMALDEEVPRSVTQRDDGVRLGRYLHKHPVSDELQVAAHRSADYAAGRLHVSS